MGKKSVSSNILWQVIALHEAGKTQRQIANQLEISKTCVQNTLTRHAETGSVAHKHRCGRKKKVTPRVERVLHRLVRSDRAASSHTLAEQLNETTHTELHPGHVRRILCNAGLKKRNAIRKPLLTKQHARNRVVWCKRRKDWDISAWKKVLFSDESTFQLHPNSRKTVRRLTSEAFKKDCVNTQLHHGGGKVTVWGGISWHGQTELHIVTRTIDSEEYINILTDKLLPFMEEQMPLRGSIFQQDNARPHTSRVTTNWFSQQNINVLPWPACSPDLNIIENIWKVLGERVAKRKPKTVAELAECLKMEWDNIPITLIHNLFFSLPRRISDCIKAKGYYFKA